MRRAPATPRRPRHRAHSLSPRSPPSRGSASPGATGCRRHRASRHQHGLRRLHAPGRLAPPPGIAGIVVLASSRAHVTPCAAPADTFDLGQSGSSTSCIDWCSECDSASKAAKNYSDFCNPASRLQQPTCHFFINSISEIRSEGEEEQVR
jgi:hypothetical protein